MRESDSSIRYTPPNDLRLLTTIDVARMLGITARGVRWLASEHRLTCERTRRGQALYRPVDIVRVVLQRAQARTWSRRQLLADLRPRMLRVGLDPRQLSLFRRVPASERALPQAEVKRPTLVRKSA